MNSLPNALTIARIAMVPLFVGAFYWPGGDIGRWLAFWLFCIAGLTDMADGMIARKYGVVSSFGRMLDPIADKLIISAALLVLTDDRTIQGWSLIPALIILAREILVSGLREFLAGADVSLPVTRIAKAKTAVQVIAIAALIACSASERLLPGVTNVALFGLWIAAALTLYTGVAYFRAGLQYARGPQKNSEKPA